MRNKLFAVFILLISILSFARFAHAQNAPDSDLGTSRVVRAQVTQIKSTGVETVAGTNTQTPTQDIVAQVIGTDPLAGSTFEIPDEDYFVVHTGSIFFVTYTHNSDGTESYVPLEPDRTPVLLTFAIIFLALLILIGGWQGIRALATLAGSLVLIIWVLIPSLLHGFSPVLLSIGVASLIIIIGSYITHGFNKTTTSAVIGMILTVIVAGILSWAAVHFGQLTGAANDEATFLSIQTNGTINLAGLLLGGILIGLLGVLYDVAIGQAIAVEELFRAHTLANPFAQNSPEYSDAKVFSRAMRIGREHIGALVNTLAIAYVGAALPLLLLFASGYHEALVVTVNREVFATEILRILVGSIGLVLAVPITTYVAVRLLRGVKFGKASEHTHTHEKVD